MDWEWHELVNNCFRKYLRTSFTGNSAAIRMVSIIAELSRLLITWKTPVSIPKTGFIETLQITKNRSKVKTKKLNTRMKRIWNEYAELIFLEIRQSRWNKPSLAFPILAIWFEFCSNHFWIDVFSIQCKALDQSYLLLDWFDLNAEMASLLLLWFFCTCTSTCSCTSKKIQANAAIF